jgi:hypothetical protein
VIWIFVRNFAQTFVTEESTDERLRSQRARLEAIVTASDASALKREALDAVGSPTAALEERRER